GWPSMMSVVAAVCAVLGLVVVWLYRAPSDAAPAVPLARSLRPNRLEATLTALAGLAWGGVNLGLVIFFSFGPMLLAAQGLDAGRAGLIVGLGLWVSMLSLPLGGLIAERIRRPTLVIGVGAALAALTLYLLPLGLDPVVLSVALGLVVGPPAAAVMALPGAIL